MTELPPALTQALAFAAHGWPVFPCKPGSKIPATDHGFKDATTDPDMIRDWWQRNPRANLAIATGAPGPDVLDIDQHGPAGNGYAACQRLRQAGLLTGAYALVATPHGGLHGYFPGTTQRTARLPRHHLDFRAAGGYILAPPSRIDGKPYRLLGTHTAPPRPLDWAAVTAILEPQRNQAPAARHQTAWPRDPGRPGDPGHLIAWTSQLPAGNRNSGLFWAACRLIESGHHDHLDDLAAAATAAGLPGTEITSTIASALRTAQHHPELTP